MKALEAFFFETKKFEVKGLVMHLFFKMENFEINYLRNNLIRHIKKGNWPPIVNILRIFSFRYEFNVSFVDNSS